MDNYIKEIISLLVEKRFAEAYELSKEACGYFRCNCKYYKNVDICRADYIRVHRYYEYASKKMLEEKRLETEMFKNFCDRLIQLNKELVDS